MKICENCFNDTELKSMLYNDQDSVTNKGRCPNCGCESILYDVKALTSIKAAMEGFLDNYVSNDDGQSIGKELKQQWNIFNDKLSEDNIVAIIKELCSEYCSERPELLSNNIILEKLLNSDYREQHKALKIPWNKFEQELIEVNRYHSRSIDKDVLKSLFTYVTIEYPKGVKFYRARSAAKDITYKKSQMGAPGPRQSGEGRINAKGVACLYLASNAETCIKEIRAGAFDYICIGEFTVMESLRLVNLSKITDISPFSQDANINPADIILNKSDLEAMNQSIQKPQSSKDNPLDYVPTQYLADYIKSITDEAGQRVYDGIEFKSTHDEVGRNIVLFDADQATCKCECGNVNKYYIESLDYKKRLAN